MRETTLGTAHTQAALHPNAATASEMMGDAQVAQEHIACFRQPWRKHQQRVEAAAIREQIAEVAKPDSNRRVITAEERTAALRHRVRLKEAAAGGNP